MSKERTFIITIEDCPDNLEAHQILEAVEHYLVVTCHVEQATRIPLEFGEGAIGDLVKVNI